MGKQRNYAAFYALCKVLEGLSENKEEVVRSYTGGRTDSLREMTDVEYNTMINGLRHEAGQAGTYRGGSRRKASTATRRLRSALLYQLQLVGVNTADWDAVDTYCLDPRIGGKRFAALSDAELGEVRKRIVAIRHREEKAERMKKATVVLLRGKMGNC